jgi:DNA-binding transcriptional MerR regulator
MPTTGSEILPIRRISALTGVNAITLRAWERRYGLIRPKRSPKGHRLYTHQHVELIRRVLALMERGVPISRVGEVIEAESAAHAGTPAGDGPWRHYVETMAAAIARFDEPELDRIYDGALSVHSVDAVTRHVTLPLLTHLGERWQGLRGAIAEEHFFSTYLRSKLGARLQHRMRYATGPRILAACAPGEQHEIGLLLFALEALDAGLRTVVLGADTPLDDIAIALRRSGSDAVVLSLSVDPPEGLLERELPRLVRQVNVPVFVGGAAALRNRAAITAAGATALGSTPEDGVRLITAALPPGKPHP